MRDLSVLILEERDFPLLAAACGGDPGFPRSWQAWQELVATAHSEGGRSDEAVQVLLDPHVFIAWCNRLDVLPCLAALRAYAILHRPENRTKRYGKKPLSVFGVL